MYSNYTDFRAQQKNFSSSDGNIKFIDEGKGAVILLLHGVPSSSWLYRKMIPGLVKAGFRVIAPDMLGFGNSGNPKAYEVYAEANHAKRLLALMDHLNIKYWYHVMHDAGGLWTWELIKKDPFRIRKLVILNTIILEAGFNPPIRMEQGLFAKFTMWMYRNGITTKMLLNALFKQGLKKNDLSKVDLEGYMRPLLEGKTNALYYFFSQTCNKLPDYRKVIQKSKIKSKVIWGAQDPMLNWKAQEEEVMDLLGLSSEDVTLVDGKHFIQEELPEELVEKISNFFN